MGRFAPLYTFYLPLWQSDCHFGRFDKNCQHFGLQNCNCHFGRGNAGSGPTATAAWGPKCRLWGLWKIWKILENGKFIFGYKYWK